MPPSTSHVYLDRSSYGDNRGLILNDSIIQLDRDYFARSLWFDQFILAINIDVETQSMLIRA